MHAFSFLLITSLTAAQPPASALPVPQIDIVWDARGGERTDSNGTYAHQAPLKVRVNVDGPVEQSSIELFLNGSTEKEEIRLEGKAQGQIVARLLRKFPRGEYRLTARLLGLSEKSELSKPFTFTVDPPEAPKVLAVYEGDAALPFNVGTQPIFVLDGNDVKVEVAGTLPGDEVKIFLSSKGLLDELARETVEDTPIRRPISIDLATIEGIQKGKDYQVLVQIVRDGDASSYGQFTLQYGMPPEPTTEPGDS